MADLRKRPVAPPGEPNRVKTPVSLESGNKQKDWDSVPPPANRNPTRNTSPLIVVVAVLVLLSVAVSSYATFSGPKKPPVEAVDHVKQAQEILSTLHDPETAAKAIEVNSNSSTSATIL